jgi:hypothetical protein
VISEVTYQKEKLPTFTYLNDTQPMNDNEDEILRENNYSTYEDVAQHSMFGSNESSLPTGCYQKSLTSIRQKNERLHTEHCACTKTLI